MRPENRYQSLGYLHDDLSAEASGTARPRLARTEVSVIVSYHALLGAGPVI